MTALVVSITLAFSLQQTPGQLLDQVDALLRQVREALAAQSVTVTTADGLTAALARGGRVDLAPGTYAGNFIVSRPTTLRGAGQATTVIVPKDLLTPPLVIMASDVTVSDLAIKNGAVDRETVVVGDPDAKTAEVQPHRVKLSRLTVTAANGGHRGVSLHGSDLTVDSCTITGFWEVGRDSQAIWGNNGPGPYTITNNLLEASGENILFGGGDPAIPGVVPSDILISGNTIRKPEAYRTLTPGGVKNLLELKNARRVLIENNAFDGNWKSGQSGNAIVFTVRNQGGKCTWCIVDDVTFRGNVLTHTFDGFGINILGSDDAGPSAQTTRITIDHNLFTDSPLGVQVINGVTVALVVTNNTFAGVTGRLLQFGKSANWPLKPTPLTFSRNVAKAGAYGIMGDGSTGPGLPSLLAYATVVEWVGNIIEQSPARVIPFPPGTTPVPAGGLAALLDPVTLKLLSGMAGY